ncbi:MAG: hypothetical protein WCR07_03080 [Verrucomicrobiota bacterium]|jgi:hypothetical protein
MSFNADALYALLPEVHRLRDHELGEARARELGLPASAGPSHRPLRQFIEVLADQAGVIEENIAQLYDNHFVETAAPWAVAYIGDLLGIRGLPNSQRLPLSARAEVGHTIGYRRRKGTASVLEALARDTTGWSAAVAEFFQHLSATQHLQHLRRFTVGTASLRDAHRRTLDRTPFESFSSRYPRRATSDAGRTSRGARTVEVRRIASGRGRWNIPNLGIHVWPLAPHAVTDSPMVAASLWDAGTATWVPSPRHRRFHPLGRDARLFGRGETVRHLGPPAQPVNVALPLSARLIQGDQWTAGQPMPPVPADRGQFHPDVQWYGAGRSVVLRESGVGGYTDVPATRVLLAELPDLLDAEGHVIGWAHDGFAAAAGGVDVILLDPRRGRAVWPQAPKGTPRASFHLGFTADIGGGEYARDDSFDRDSGIRVRVSNQVSAIPALPSTITAGLTALGANQGYVEIQDSGRYPETPAIAIADQEVEIRGRDGTRPVWILEGDLMVEGQPGGTLVLNGLLISGGAIRVRAAGTQEPLRRLVIRHCTVVPRLLDSGRPDPAKPAVIVETNGTAVDIESSIIAGVRVATDCRVTLRDTIVDVGSVDLPALADPAGTGPGGFWTLTDCTIRGRVRATQVALASNTLFDAAGAPGIPPVSVLRRQEGCIRFCWVPRDSTTPRRHRCLPADDGPDTGPVLDSTRWLDAAYARLSGLGPVALLTGADDDGEIGAFHGVFAPQRLAHLEARLDEHLRLGLQAGIISTP